MPRLPGICAIALVAACDTGASPAVVPTPPPVPSQDQPNLEWLGAELAVGRAGCVRCHQASPDDAARLTPVRGPALAETAGWRARDGGASFLRRHHGGDDSDDLAAWVRSLSNDGGLQPAATNKAAMRRGESLFGELACGACHAGDQLAHLAGRTDHAHVTAFLMDPRAHRPGVVHDFGLTSGEASAIAAWLLRMQVREGEKARVPGFAFECFELQIENGDPPNLDGLEVSAQGVVDEMDIEPRTRQNHFALRFRAALDVPNAGEWRFIVGSDDGSWLRIDGDLVVDNGGLKPHRERDGTVRLDAGLHEIEVVFTQAGGGKSLGVQWEGPGVAKQTIPAERATADTTAMVPPETLPAPDPDAVGRGRAAAIAKRCVACHAIEDPQMLTLPPGPFAKSWGDLTAGTCPETPAAEALLAPAKAGLAQSLEDAALLTLNLQRDDCLACHARDGRGGLPAAVQKHLVETEDLGDEGRLPPDLTLVGQRLRQAWIEKVLTEGHKARTYLRARMPRVDAQRAAEYAALFARVDGDTASDTEPTFSIAAVEAGHKAAGTQGRNCISCHSFAGAPSIGVQGMDLAIQHQRVRPAWFREWLLHAPQLRQGTRMPVFWPMDSAEDHAEIDAIRTWLSLGAAAPIPEGLVPEKGSMVLLPSDRPILHGAFLDGLSARCIAVGSNERTHYAFDVEHARLAWLWRGEYVDSTGTWHGRAGKLVKPLGEDWLVLEDFGLAGTDDRTVLGHRIDEAGYPHFRVRVADSEYEDSCRPRLALGGSEIVRTLRCIEGGLTIEWPQQDGVELLIAGQPANGRTSVTVGQELEIVYRW